MPRKLDKTALKEELLRHLRVKGRSGADGLLQALRISQPMLSRLIRDSADDDEVLVTGRARATLYAARRNIDGVGKKVPLYEVLEDATTRTLCVLHAVEPQGFYVEATCGDITAHFYDDLPYFLHDQRPSGFLGRLVPKRHPELRLPDDIRLWSADDCLRYLSRFGSNQAGSILVGDDSFRAFLESAASPPDAMLETDKASHYARAAEDKLSATAAGSSAAGEQPKFLATLMPEYRSVLVKFSPKRHTAVAHRTADLLVCEHIAHETLRAHGVLASHFEIVESHERLFLEVERFDRRANTGRRGCISLMPANAEFLGGSDRWEDIAEGLRRARIISAELAQRVVWLDIFGELIANNDRHPGNLSFITKGCTVTDVAPVYDMLPMLYAPRGGELVDATFDPPVPLPRWKKQWESACAASIDFWQRVAQERKVSAQFQSIARDNVNAVTRVAALGHRLP